MFEQAREAMEKGEASQPSVDSTANQSSSPSTTTESTAYAPQETTQQAQPSTVHDLEKLGKFMFGGKEYTPQELKSAMMRQEDYTRKTQELAQERRFNDNLSIDLKAVRENPALADQFKSIYPEKYHAYLDFILNNVEPKPQQTTQEANTQQKSLLENDPYYKQLKSELDEWKEFQTQEQIKQAEKTIDNILETMATKFKITKEMRGIAEEMVVNRANSATMQNMPMNNETWDKIYTKTYEDLIAFAKSYNKTLINQQQDANHRARDASSGGQPPGQSPKKMSFREATEAAVRDAQTAR